MANAIDIYVDFIENHLAGIKSGDYVINITHTITGAGGINEPYSNSSGFSIAGERYNLKPANISGVFPPAGTSGEYSNVLPHIVLDRNTLPWERLMVDPVSDEDRKQVEKMPWMALLIFNEDELQPGPGNTNVADVEQGLLMSLQDVRSKLKIHDKSPERADQPDDQLAVIYAKKSLLEKLILPASQLTRICHARKSSLRLNIDMPNIITGDMYCEIRNTANDLVDAIHLQTLPADKMVVLPCSNLLPGNYHVTLFSGETAANEHLLASKDLAITLNDEFGHDVAIVVTNRLPKRGGKSIAHLVSLEGRFKKSEDGKDFQFDFASLQPDDLVPLVSLTSWTFFCEAEHPSFMGILANLAHDDISATERQLKLPLPEVPNGSELAANYLSNGYNILPHFFRAGGKSMSWYRGALTPGKTGNRLPGLLPAACADELLMYDESLGMLDASFAAAWQLGRLLALQNKPFSTSLYKWKRLHRRQLNEAENSMLPPHLPPFYANAAALDLPDEVDGYFSELSLLKGVPFNYLVPDERMLPAESLRFFNVDQEWISCLIDGAFSIGRVTQRNQQHDLALMNNYFKEPFDNVCGFMLRSKVVSGWPTLQVNGYIVANNGQKPEEAPQLNLLRMDRLSPDVLCCLFDGEIGAVAIHQKPEMIHWGFDIQPGVEETYTKNGKPVIADADRIIDINNLFEMTRGNAPVFTAAQFALALIEGVEKVLFLQKSF